jgi:hypothetical protein
MNSCGRLALFVTVAAVTTAQASTISPIIDISGGADIPVVGGSNVTSGFAFGVASSLVISGLGLFDVGADGLINAHEVGLWTSSGTLLASAMVTNSANVVASTDSLGEWLEVNIAPVTLAAGSYVLGAFYFNANTHTEDDAVWMTTASSISGVSYQNGSVLVSSTFGFPNESIPATSSDARIFGPMAFTGASVPEPGSFALFLCGAALLGALWVFTPLAKLKLVAPRHAWEESCARSRLFTPDIFLFWSELFCSACSPACRVETRLDTNSFGQES